jgi:hypothetical protein
VFNLHAGEIFVIVALLVIFLGPLKPADLARRWFERSQAASEGPAWRPSEWWLVSGVLALGALALALAAHRG